jgi:hypothetical protein
MMRRLERRRSESRLAATLLRAPAEDLPFEDDSFGVAVSTLVLCTADDQPRALRQRDRGQSDSGCQGGECLRGVLRAAIEGDLAVAKAEVVVEVHVGLPTGGRETDAVANERVDLHLRSSLHLS